MESVLLNHAPREVVRALLIQLGVGTDGQSYAAWPVFHGMEPNDPDNCITLFDDDSTHHGRTQVNGEVQEHYNVEIRVRAAGVTTGTALQHGSQAVRSKINSIVRALDQQVRMTNVNVTNEMGNTTPYVVHAASRNGGVADLGRQRENKERYVNTVSYSIAITQTV